MVRIRQTVRNMGVMEIEIDPEAREVFKKKLFTALQKFSSSKKTRAVHKLIAGDVVSMGSFSGNAAESLFVNYAKGNTVANIVLNAYLFDDALDIKGATTLAQRLAQIKESIQKEKTFIKDEQIKNIEELNERKKEVTDKFLNSLDYLKAIDGLYFAWLNLLTGHIIEHQKNMVPKIITTAADALASILKKIYMKVEKDIGPDEHQLIEAISIYFIHIYFLGKSSTYTLNIMQKADNGRTAFKEETIESLRMSKVTKFNEFEDLGLLLKETGLMSMTPNTFRMQMENYFGKYGYQEYLSTSLESFIAFLANLSYPNQIFKDAYPVDDDVHKRLEELILNGQKSYKIGK